MALNSGKILCLFGVKGGIGKSILTMSLAGVCSNKKIKTLIIDLDIYGGSIALALNKPVVKNVYNFFDDYNNNRYKNIKEYISNYNEYIDFIAAPKDPRKSNKIDSSYIELLLDKAKFNYDLILVDTNHILNEINLTILDKSSDILLVMTNDTFDIKNMRNLISIFKDLDKDNYKLLLNNSIQINKGYYNIYDIIDVIKNNIDYTISKDFYYKEIEKSIVEGNIITFDKKIIGSKDYHTLENIIVNVVGEKDE